MAANWIITLTSSEQWRSERKEGRGKKCGLLGQLVPCTLGRMKARLLKMQKDVMTFRLTTVTKVVAGFAVCLLSHYEFSQLAKVVCVCFPVCVPVFSSISLDLLPERTATLMVYEEVVEIVSGIQGKKTIPAFTFTLSD